MFVFVTFFFGCGGDRVQWETTRWAGRAIPLSVRQKISFCPGKGDQTQPGSTQESKRNGGWRRGGRGGWGWRVGACGFNSSESITGGSDLASEGEGAFEHLPNAANRSDISDIGEREARPPIRLGLREPSQSD